MCYNSSGGGETSAADRPQIHRDNQFTPSQIYASVYTQEKFTLKFYLTNAIIEDKKISVNFALERILEKGKRESKFLSVIVRGRPIDENWRDGFCLFSLKKYRGSDCEASDRVLVFT